MNARLVNWIGTAYEDIQRLHESWLFRVGEFSFSTIDGTQNYTPDGVSITDLAYWKYDPDPNNLSGIRLYSSESDEADLIYFPWDDFRATYKFGSARSQSGRPTIFSIKPDMSMDLWAIPDAVYTVNGEYIKTVDTLSTSDNTDTPVIPSDHHMIIVWKALMLYGSFEGAPEAYSHGEKEYKGALAKLKLNQLPRMVYGSPLV